ncbi:MAG TPA: GNAT family N-acetyltransferase [Burkholderiales bacterium]
MPRRTRPRELTAADLPLLQRFLEANPDYHLLVSGEPPAAGAAQEIFDSRPPEDYLFERKWLLRFDDESDVMIGMAEGLSNLFAEGVWHIGLFIVATHLHGTGRALGLYGSLEAWLRKQGGRWSRLGVVEGNARAERFWEKLGYRQVRTRSVEMGRRTNNVRVMVKPLADATVSQYLALVKRDRPD